MAWTAGGGAGLAAGSRGTPPSVTIACAVTGADIHYTLNGVDPTTSDPTMNPLNPTETEYCRQHPLTCLVASPCRLFSQMDQYFVGADQWTKQGGYPDHGPLNAWKHCNWACCMTRLVGADAAATIAENHESEQKPTQPCESRMDTMNNRVGINAAASNPMTGCHDLCTNSKKLQCSPPPAPCQPFGR